MEYKPSSPRKLIRVALWRFRGSAKYSPNNCFCAFTRSSTLHEGLLRMRCCIAHTAASLEPKVALRIAGLQSLMPLNRSRLSWSWIVSSKALLERLEINEYSALNCFFVLSYMLPCSSSTQPTSSIILARWLRARHIQVQIPDDWYFAKTSKLTFWNSLITFWIVCNSL